MSELAEESRNVSGEEQASEPVENEQQPTGTTDEGGEPEGESEGEEEFVVSLDDDPGEDDSDDSDDEGEEKGQKKLTAQERIQQEIARRKELEERIKELEQGRGHEQEQRPPEPPKYVEIDQQKFESHINSLYSDAEDLRLEGRTLQALEKEEEARGLLRAYKENEKAKQQAQEFAERQRMTEQQRMAFAKQVDETAELFRQRNNIPKEVWDQGAKWFDEQLRSDPVLGREFAYLLEKNPVEGIRFANDYVNKNMGRSAEEAKKKRDSAKNTNPGGKGDGGKNTATVKSFQQLMNLGSKAVANFKKQNPDAYQKLLNKHIKG
jgi:CRISPR/Cas system CMR subunit Cmr4 (Cas7 group RAMP superfamily)